MRIDIISAVPEILASPLKTSIIKRSLAKKLVEIRIIVHDTHLININLLMIINIRWFRNGLQLSQFLIV